jgi:hypothetical protein
MLHSVARFLTFRASREELLAVDKRHLIFGLLATWIVGIGRYWDDPGASLLQHLGLGSLIYVVVLSAILWLVVRPLGATDFSYRRVLTLVCLTSPPAILYAIPVERFMSLDAATSANVWFLAVVALWRVALLVLILRRVAALTPFAVAVASLLPLTAIVTSLTFLNLERVLVDVMAGLREAHPGSAAYSVVLVLTFLSWLVVGPAILAWLVLVFRAQRRTLDPRS